MSFKDKSSADSGDFNQLFLAASGLPDMPPKQSPRPRASKRRPRHVDRAIISSSSEKPRAEPEAIRVSGNDIASDAETPRGLAHSRPFLEMINALPDPTPFWHTGAIFWSTYNAWKAKRLLRLHSGDEPTTFNAEENARLMYLQSDRLKTPKSFGKIHSYCMDN